MFKNFEKLKVTKKEVSQGESNYEFKHLVDAVSPEAMKAYKQAKKANVLLFKEISNAKREEMGEEVIEEYKSEYVAINDLAKTYFEKEIKEIITQVRTAIFNDMLYDLLLTGAWKNKVLVARAIGEYGDVIPASKVIISNERGLYENYTSRFIRTCCLAAEKAIQNLTENKLAVAEFDFEDKGVKSRFVLEIFDDSVIKQVLKARFKKNSKSKTLSPKEVKEGMI